MPLNDVEMLAPEINLVLSLVNLKAYELTSNNLGFKMFQQAV